MLNSQHFRRAWRGGELGAKRLVGRSTTRSGQTVLSGVETVSLTTDSWMSRSTENYISVTAHYITAEWEMGSYLLECVKYSEHHTAENLRDELLRVIREWKLEGKIVAVCTDNAANITAAVKLAKLKHLPALHRL